MEIGNRFTSFGGDADELFADVRVRREIEYARVADHPDEQNYLRDLVRYVCGIVGYNRAETGQNRSLCYETYQADDGLKLRRYLKIIDHQSGAKPHRRFIIGKECSTVQRLAYSRYFGLMEAEGSVRAVAQSHFYAGSDREVWLKNTELEDEKGGLTWFDLRYLCDEIVAFEGLWLYDHSPRQ